MTRITIRLVEFSPCLQVFKSLLVKNKKANNISHSHSEWLPDAGRDASGDS